MSQPSEVHRSEEPHERMTRMCDAMTKQFDRHPEKRKGDKCIVFLDDGENHRAGLVLHGYDDDIEAMVNLIMHLKAMFAANDKQMDIAFLSEEGVWRG